MKPHNENFEEYGRLCRERTNKSMIKNRQIQVRPICYCLSPTLLTPFAFPVYDWNCFDHGETLFIPWLLKQVIDNDRGVHMRPMPGLVGLGANAKVLLHYCTVSLSFSLLISLYLAANMCGSNLFALYFVHIFWLLNLYYCINLHLFRVWPFGLWCNLFLTLLFIMKFKLSSITHLYFMNHA